MNINATWLVMGLVAVTALHAPPSRAQQHETSPIQISPTRDRLGRVVVPDRPTMIDAPQVFGRPDVVDRPDLTPEVKTRIELFRREARAYLERQEALRKELLGATDEERARIRTQLEDIRQQWLERSRQMREEFQDRREELIRKMPERQEIIDSTREAVREQMRDARGEIRKRRGDE